MQWRWLSVLVVTAVILPPVGSPARAAPSVLLLDGTATVEPVSLAVEAVAAPSTLAGARAATRAGLFTADAHSFAPGGEEFSLSLRAGGDTSPSPSACAWPVVAPAPGVVVERRCVQVSVDVAARRAAGGASVPRMVVSSSVLGGLAGRLVATRGANFASAIEAALLTVASPNGDLAGPVIAQLRPGCVDAVEAAPPSGSNLAEELEELRSGPADALAGPVGAVADAHAQAGDPLPSACRALADLLEPGLVDPVAPDAVASVAVAALMAADTNLATVEVGRSDGVVEPSWASASVSATADAATARADSPYVRVALGSLAPAAAGLVTHLGTEVDRLVSRVAELVVDVPGVTVPAADAVRAAAGAALVLPAWLTAAGDAVVAEVEAGGTVVERTAAGVRTTIVPAIVRVSVAPDLAAALGVATVTEAGPGEVAEVLAGSPWRIRVRGGTAASASGDGGGTEAATLALFDDALVLAVGATSADVTTSAPARPAPSPTVLPRSEELPAAGAGLVPMILAVALAATALGWSALGARRPRGTQRR